MDVNVGAIPVAVLALLMAVLVVAFRRKLTNFSRRFEGDEVRENDSRNWLAVLAPVAGVTVAAFVLFYDFS